NSPDDRMLPVIIRGNQSLGAVVQFQCRILHWIGDAVLAKLRANGAYDDSLCSRALDNETANHHVVTGLHKAAGADVTDRCRRRTRGAYVRLYLGIEVGELAVFGVRTSARVRRRPATIDAHQVATRNKK